ncbi:hypothetical protein BC829DRAFT_438735 [Chytridium lagenaria]|nr:hypothetical protein BC829DRAFT_438735 [Chytridium lagenaria]
MKRPESDAGSENSDERRTETSAVDNVSISLSTGSLSQSSVKRQKLESQTKENGHRKDGSVVVVLDDKTESNEDSTETFHTPPLEDAIDARTGLFENLLQQFQHSSSPSAVIAEIMHVRNQGSVAGDDGSHAANGSETERNILNIRQGTFARTSQRPPSPAATIVYDIRLLGHTRASSENDPVLYPEIPERIRGIYLELRTQGLLERCLMLQPKPARAESENGKDDPLLLVHTPAHIRNLEKSRTEDDEGLRKLAKNDEDIFFTPDTAYCARLACGGVIEACRAVLAGKVVNAFAVIRPRGITRRKIGWQILAEGTARKVLIVDWDVHHGNGTQKAFYSSPDVLYVSVHRYENADFYPYESIADADHIGSGLGKGRNVNVPWPCAGMGDAEYLYVWRKILLPMAIEFEPDLVVVSAGFDAADGDPLGGCRITPDGFGHLTRSLMGLAGGGLFLRFAGEPMPQKRLKEPKIECIQTSSGGVIGITGKGPAQDRLYEATYPLYLPVSWYNRSVLIGLLNLRPLALPQTKIIRKGVVHMGAVDADDVDAPVDPVQVYASSWTATGDLAAENVQITDGASPYYHEFLSRGHPIVSTEIQQEFLTKHSAMSFEDALRMPGREFTEKCSPSKYFVLIGAGRGSEVVQYLLHRYADNESRIVGALQFCHESRPKKVVSQRGPRLLHTFLSGLNLDSTSTETVDDSSSSVAELMIRNFPAAISHIKKKILTMTE